eukprot:m.223516 g.223516  ORF g.223516 m.223516 type:complete len:329 (-) comp33403_c2_seq1:729-1715(-)
MFSSVSKMATVVVFGLMSACVSAADPETKMRVFFVLESNPPPGVTCAQDHENAMDLQPDITGPGRAKRTETLLGGFTEEFADVSGLSPDSFEVDGVGVETTWMPDVDDDFSDDWMDDGIPPPPGVCEFFPCSYPMGTLPPTHMPNNPYGGGRQHREAPPPPPAPPVPESCTPILVVFTVRLFQPLEMLSSLRTAVTEGFASEDSHFGFVYNDGDTVMKPHAIVVTDVVGPGNGKGNGNGNGNGNGMGKGNAHGNAMGKGGGRQAREVESAGGTSQSTDTAVDHSMVAAVSLAVGTLSVILAGVYAVIRKNRTPEINDEALEFVSVSER